MGMTVPESASFLLGAALIVRFLLGSAIPEARRYILDTANRHSENLREEFLRLPPLRIVGALVLSCLLCGAIVLWMTKSGGVATAAGILPLSLSSLAVRGYRSRRRKAILERLPALLDLLAGHVKAGYSLPESFAETVPLLPCPIREEMSWVLQQNRLGAPLTEALSRWEKRIAADEVSLFVRPLRAALPGGGNVAALLEQIRDILRQRARGEEKLRSMTAQARLQGIVLTLLPPVFALILSRIDPGFLPALIGTPHGKTVVFAAALLLALGWLTIRKILSVRP